MKSAIDLKLRDRDFQCSLIGQHFDQIGLEQQFLKVVFLAGFGQSTCPESPKKQPAVRRYDLTKPLAELMRQSRICEVVGSGIYTSESVLYYTTLATLEPKPYFPTYIELLRELHSKTEMPVIVWIEDLMSLPRFRWSTDTLQQAKSSTQEWFLDQRLEITVRTCSESANGIVPLDFIQTVFGNCTVADFMSVLSFHKHDVALVSVRDITHFIWSVYISSCFPGLHLTASNNKRNHLLLRKLCGKQFSAALVHPVPTR